MRGDHVARAVFIAMEDGRTQDAVALLQECLFSPPVISYVTTRWYTQYDDRDLRVQVAGSIRERMCV